MKNSRLALIMLLAAAAVTAYAEVVIHTRDGRTFRVPVEASQVATIEFDARIATPIQAELSFLHAPGGPGANWSKAHPDTSINYLDWNGSKWTAKIQGERFLHAPNGDWSKAHSDDVIHYLSWNGSKWAAKIEGGRFLHAPDGDWSKAHPDDIAIYRTWDGSAWTARLVTGQ
jgi:hypothetical protein